MNQHEAQSLYERDFYQWIEETSHLLEEGKFAQLDIQNLVEELQTMGRSEKRAIRSNLTVLLHHLLKWKYQPNKQSSSWVYTIREHRKRIKDLLRDSPSLSNYLVDALPECYEEARYRATRDTKLPINTFPVDCIFSLEVTLEREFEQL